MRPMITRLRTRAYQFSLRTGKPRTMCSATSPSVRCRGSRSPSVARTIWCSGPQQRRRYGGDVAVLLGLAIVLAVLILTAVTPVLIVLLPLALLPGVPLLDRQPSRPRDQRRGRRPRRHPGDRARPGELGACRRARRLPRLAAAPFAREHRGRTAGLGGPLGASYFSSRMTATTTPSRLQLACVDRLHGAVLGLQADPSRLRGRSA